MWKQCGAPEDVLDSQLLTILYRWRNRLLDFACAPLRPSCARSLHIPIPCPLCHLVNTCRGWRVRSSSSELRWINPNVCFRADLPFLYSFLSCCCALSKGIVHPKLKFQAFNAPQMQNMSPFCLCGTNQEFGRLSCPVWLKTVMLAPCFWPKKIHCSLLERSCFHDSYHVWQVLASCKLICSSHEC